MNTWLIAAPATVYFGDITRSFFRSEANKGGLFFIPGEFSDWKKWTECVVTEIGLKVVRALFT